MPDENGTDTTRPDAPGADDALFGEAADDKPAVAVEEEDSTDQTKQDGQGSDDAGEQDGKAEATEGEQGSDDAGEQDAEAETAEDEQAADDAGEETDSSDDLKVVVSIKGGRATIGVQRPSADPHIETFDDGDLASLAQEVPAVTERARARWEDAPKHPAYERPAPPARRRNRRQQGAAQDATTPDAETQEAETQQQTLRLF